MPHLDGSAQVDAAPIGGQVITLIRGTPYRRGNAVGRAAAAERTDEHRPCLGLARGCWLSGILLIIVISAWFVAQPLSGNILRVASPVPGLSLPAQINT